MTVCSECVTGLHQNQRCNWHAFYQSNGTHRTVVVLIQTRRKLDTCCMPASSATTG